jgi:glyoxylase-like metal-dependent hydrolase (beta-lactamase superfamily II)
MEENDNISCISFDTTYFGNSTTYCPTLVDSPQGALLFDVGGPGDTDALEAAINSAGYDFSDICKVMITHHDLDHGGCLADVVSETGAEVVAHHKAVPYLNGDRVSIKRRDTPITGTNVDIELTGGERFLTSAGPLEAIFTPGHNPDHLVFYLPDVGVLIAGDLFAITDEPSLATGAVGNFTGPKKEPTVDMFEAFESMEKMLDLNIETTICFHGGIADAGTPEIRKIHAQGPTQNTTR